MASQHRQQIAKPRRIGYFIRLCTILMVSSVTMPAAADLLVGTGGVGSFSFFTGRALCRDIGRSDIGWNCQVVPAPDGVHNLTNLQEGSLDLALVDSKLLHDAAHNAGYFKFMDIRYDNLGILLPLYDLPMLLMTRKEAQIDGVGKIAGKRINAGAPASIEHRAMDLIMATKGWARKDFKVFQELPATQSQDTMAFCHGSIEAMLHVGVHPDSRLEQLMGLCGAVPVGTADADMIRMAEAHPAFSIIRIPADTYPGMRSAIEAIGTTIFLVASLSLDEATGRAIMSVLEQNQSRLKSTHPALSGLSVKPFSGKDVNLKLHPGAAAFFSAMGSK